MNGCEFLQCVQQHWLGNKLWLGSISNKFMQTFSVKMIFQEKKKTPFFFSWQKKLCQNYIFWWSL